MTTDLIPTLLSLSTTKLPFSTLATSLQQVSIYVSKFRKRLSPVNGLHLKRLVTYLDALKKYALEWKEQCKDKPMKTEVMSVLDLSARLGRRVTGINLLEIEAYLKKSKVSYKNTCIIWNSDEFRSQGRLPGILKNKRRKNQASFCASKEFVTQHQFRPKYKTISETGFDPSSSCSGKLFVIVSRR